MSQNYVILLLGSNSGDRNSELETAQSFIQKEIGEIEKKTGILETEPVGFDSPNKFLNQIIFVKTAFSPVALLKSIKEIEKKMGRTYLPTQQKYQDRIIDIDILKFNELIFESEKLIIPHHQMVTRNFITDLFRLK